MCTSCPFVGTPEHFDPNDRSPTDQEDTGWQFETLQGETVGKMDFGLGDRPS